MKVPGLLHTVLVAPDSFKGSLSAARAAAAIARGVRRVRPDADVRELPLSDGGEGFVELLGGQTCEAPVHDALGRPITARYSRLDGATVAIALSDAAGLAQLAAGERDPLVASTRGVGELIAAAWPFETLLLGVGGSATVDGGVGLLQALGVRFLDENGAELAGGGAALASLARIDRAPLCATARMILAVDVTNPLLGERGAARVFGPQKGAGPAAVAILERGLARLADVLQATTGRDVRNLPGAGAAGGVSASLVALCDAAMRPGFEIVADAVGLAAALDAADVVISGEGRLDEQSFEGKVVGRLAARCRERGLPMVAIAGSVTPAGEARLAAAGGMAVSLTAGGIAVEEAVDRAESLLEAAAGRVAAAWEVPS